MPSALSRHRSVLSLKWILVAVAVAGAAASSLRPAVVVFWNDSPAFLLSALRTIESHFPTVFAGRDIGYPLFLAFWLDLTGTLESVVVAQQIIFVLIVAIVAFALVNITNNICYALFSVMLAMYPGLLIYKQIILSETLYTFVLTAAACILLIAYKMKPSALTIVCCLAVFLAAIGATVRSLGIPPFLVISCLAVVMVVRQRRIRYIAVLVPFVALSCGLVAANAWLKSISADDFTRVFATKILFCNHLQIALRSPAVLTTVSDFGQNSKEILSEIESLYVENPAGQRMLEYHVEPCLFGRHLDDLLIEGAGISRNELPELYRLLFWQTVSGNPLDYLTKVGRQMIYGTVMSWPPHGLEPVIAGSPSARDRTIEILQQNGFDTRELVAAPGFVETWFLSRQAFSNHLFRGLSLVFFVAIFSIPILWVVRDRIDRRRLWQLLSVTLIWFSNLMAIAASNTLDVWRYIVPTTPIATLILALSLSLWMQAVSRRASNPIPSSSS